VSVWKQVKVGEFLFEREGRYKPDSPEIAGLQRIDKIDFSGNFHIANKPSKTDMILIKHGDLVISGINVAKGALGVYNGDSDVTATIHYSSYTFDESKISVEYFKRFLKSPIFIQLLKDQVKGGIKTEIKPKHLLPLKIMLPDKEEQLSILRRFQHIENEDFELKHELTHQQTLLKKLRQQILQEAIEGKLTDDWRVQNSEAEPASELLKRVAAEKSELIRKKKLKKGGTTSKSVTHRQTVIPETWSWCKADEILFVTKLAGFEYTKHISLQEVGEVPVVRAQNVRPFRIRKEKLKFIDMKTSELLSRCALIKPSLLVTFIGAGIGDVALFDEPQRWHLAPNVAKLEPFENCEASFSLRFLNIFLQSKTGNAEIFKHVKATAQPSLSMGTIRDIDFPIPPYPEQQAIVGKVDKLLVICDQLETQITQNQTHAEQLMQAVLKEVFSSKSEDLE
jgi:type I restriction enzyme, S subunit